MKITRAFAMLFGTLAATGILWAATTQGQPTKPSGQEWKEVDAEISDLSSKLSTQDAERPPKVGGFARTFGAVFASPDEAKYKEVAPGASMAVISGDPDKGAHRTFTKFVPGANFPLHTHTNGMHIVVIRGAYLYKPEKGEEKRIGPGCYLDIPGGDRHASGGDAKEGALFYQESAGKFDLVPLEKEPK